MENEIKQKNTVFEVARWVLFLPVAFFIAFLPVGIVALFMEQARLEDWYVWVIYGVLYAPTFMVIALFIAPGLNAFAKWSAVISLLLIGSINTIGTYIIEDKLAGYFGIAVIVLSACFAIIPVQKWAWFRRN